MKRSFFPLFTVPLFRFYLGDCAHKSALLFGPITEHFLHHHPASFSSAPLPKQCMNLSKGKMLYHLANEYFIVCKTMYSLAFDLPLFLPLRPLARRWRMRHCRLAIRSFRAIRRITSGTSLSSAPIGPFDKAECFCASNVL